VQSSLHLAFDVVQLTPFFLHLAGSAVTRLPSMCASAQKPPALLQLCVTITAHNSLWPIYEHYSQALTPALISCLSTGEGLRAPVIGEVLLVLERLTERSEGALLLPYIPAVVSHQAMRLDKLPPGRNDNLLERELGVLCRISQMAATLAGKGLPTPDGATLDQLFGLLLPRLRTRRLRNESKVLVLQTYRALAAHMLAPRKDVVLLCKLLGPAGLAVGMGPDESRESMLRDALVGALQAIADREDARDLRPSLKVSRGRPR
jgi:hypothetical protein